MHFDSFERHTLIYNYSLFAPVCLPHTYALYSTHTHTHTPLHTHTHTPPRTPSHWSYWGFAVWFVWSLLAVIQYASVIHKCKGQPRPPRPPPPLPRLRILLACTLYLFVAAVCLCLGFSWISFNILPPSPLSAVSYCYAHLHALAFISCVARHAAAQTEASNVLWSASCGNVWWAATAAAETAKATAAGAASKGGNDGGRWCKWYWIHMHSGATSS